MPDYCVLFLIFYFPATKQGHERLNQQSLFANTANSLRRCAAIKFGSRPFPLKTVLQPLLFRLVCPASTFSLSRLQRGWTLTSSRPSRDSPPTPSPATCHDACVRARVRVCVRECENYHVTGNPLGFSHSRGLRRRRGEVSCGRKKDGRILFSRWGKAGRARARMR